jgi:hypothetical protein
MKPLKDTPISVIISLSVSVVEAHPNHRTADEDEPTEIAEDNKAPFNVSSCSAPQ